MKKTILAAISILISGILSAQCCGIKRFANASSHFTMPKGVTTADYLPQTIIFKLKPQYRASARMNGLDVKAFNEVLSNLGAPVVARKFPYHQPPATDRAPNGEKTVDLSLIYYMKYSSDADIVKVINRLLSLGLFEFAEPWYMPKLCYTPNDSLISNQIHLNANLLNCYNAWNISQGDPNLWIGITDTGTDFNHPDLGNYATNPGEMGLDINNNPKQSNGIDDDGNGRIDDWRGYDLGENDNYPQVNALWHGCHVTGLACATTDNGKGVAGVSFKCKYLPVKIDDAGGNLVAAYDGIVYAADMGCKVINCSWGGPGGGAYGQSIIDYANSKDALVVAAAGNDSKEEDFFPAAYDKVFAVACTTNGDLKAAFSNWGCFVDVCAPGSPDYSTWPGNNYINTSGTSMSSPCVAGAAGLVRSYYPSYTALQAGERLRQTCDNIYNINAPYIDKLGNGRVNCFRSLSDPIAPGMVFTTKNISDNNDETYEVGDTLRVFGVHTNYLTTTSNCVATLSTTSPYIQMLQSTYSIGTLATLASNTQPNTLAAAFRAMVTGTPPLNTTVTFKITYTDGTYSQSYCFTVTINPDYINIPVNDVWSTATTRARLGYNQDGQLQGLGFDYQLANPPQTVMYESSFMLGVSSTKVSDMFRGTGAQGDTDFTRVQNIQKVTPQYGSVHETKARFNDNSAGASAINGANGIKVNQRSFAWNTTGNRKYIIWQYGINNSGSTAINNLYAGIVTDWDIQNYATNKVNEDVGMKLGYGYQTVGSPKYYVGTKLLTSGPFNHYGIDNMAGGGGGVDPVGGGFDTNEKFTVLSTGRSTAGVTGNGNDIMDCVSSGPFSLNPGDSVVVAFALVIGDSLSDLLNTAGNAQAMYDSMVLLGTSEIPNAPASVRVYPNPSEGKFTFFASDNVKYDLLITDVLGNVLHNEKMVADHVHAVRLDLPAGVYFYRITTSDRNNSTGKLVITR